MCATCGCGQKNKRNPAYGKGPSGKNAYNMSKAMRNFNFIADSLSESIEKGLPSVARQAMRSGKDTSDMSTAMQFRMGMNQTGRNAARNLKATGGSPFASSSMAAGQGGKQTYRNLTGQNNAVDRGKLGGEQGKKRLAELTARRQARQAALAQRVQQNKQATGRGVLP